VVCHANLCRSPYAAAGLRRRFDALGLRIDVASAGYFNPNRAPPPEAIDAAAQRGIDMSTHRPQLVNKALLDAADLVVVMDTALSRAVRARRKAAIRVLVLGDLDPEPIATRAILDPFGNPRAAFDHCYARIDRCTAELARTLVDRA
jgi:protein-tyrosine phosphatase